MVFLSQNGNMIFTDYWKVLVLIFSGIGNKIFFCVKKLMERRYSLVTEKLLFWTFRWWEIRSFFRQKVDGKMIFLSFHDIPGFGKYGFLRSNRRSSSCVNFEKKKAEKLLKGLTWRDFMCQIVCLVFWTIGTIFLLKQFLEKATHARLKWRHHGRKQPSHIFSEV